MVYLGDTWYREYRAFPHKSGTIASKVCFKYVTNATCPTGAREQISPYVVFPVLLHHERKVRYHPYSKIRPAYIMPAESTGQVCLFWKLPQELRDEIHYHVSSAIPDSDPEAIINGGTTRSGFGSALRGLVRVKFSISCRKDETANLPREPSRR